MLFLYIDYFVNMTEAFIRLLRDTVEEIDCILTANYHENRELCLRRLEVLAEQAMRCDGVNLNIVDLLNQAKNIIRRDTASNDDYCSYQTPQEITGRRGRPRFFIAEEQLHLFQSNVVTVCFNKYL